MSPSAAVSNWNGCCEKAATVPSFETSAAFNEDVPISAQNTVDSAPEGKLFKQFFDNITVVKQTAYGLVMVDAHNNVCE